MNKTLGILVAAIALCASSPPAVSETAAKPYKAVAISFRPAPADADFAAFRKRFAEVVAAKNTQALRALVRPRGFFWERDFGGGFERKKPAFDNFAAAVQLDAQDGAGWAQLAVFTREAAGRHYKRRDVYCTPAEPRYNEKDVVAVMREIDISPFEWAYPRKAGVVVRAKPEAAAETIDTLGLHFVRVFLEEMQDKEPKPDELWTRVHTPSGKIGYVASADLLSSVHARLCFAKDKKAGWQVVGYIGGGD